MDDQPSTADRIQERLAQLDRYRAAYAEVYGRQPPDSLETDDPILRNLREATP